MFEKLECVKFFFKSTLIVLVGSPLIRFTIPIMKNGYFIGWNTGVGTTQITAMPIPLVNLHVIPLIM